MFPLALLSLIAGNFQEGLSIGISGALIIYWIQNIKKFSIAQYVMAVCFGLGTLVICLSPAAHDRAMIGEDMYSKIYSIKDIFFYTRALYFLLAVLAYKLFIQKVKVATIYKESSFYWNIFFILLLFNCAIGIYNNRQLFGMELMAVIIGIRLLGNIKVNKAINIAFAIILLGTYTMQAKQIARFNKSFAELEQQYVTSPTGVVYTSANIDYIMPYDRSFSEPFFYFTNIKGGFPAALGRDYRHKFKTNKELLILPIELKGLDKMDIGNQVIMTSDLQGVYLQSKSKPGRCKVEKSYAIFGKTFSHSEDIITFVGVPMYETEKWQAYSINKIAFGEVGPATVTLTAIN